MTRNRKIDIFHIFSVAGFTLAVVAASMAPQGGIAQTSTSASAPLVAAPSVTVAKVMQHDFVARAAISGSVVAVNTVSVVPQISGYPVTALNVDTGDSVTKGQVLAVLDTANLTALFNQSAAQLEGARAAVRQATSQVAAAQAQADQAKTTLDRVQKLVNDGAEAKSSLDQATATSLATDATLAEAKDGLVSAQSQLGLIQAQHDLAQLNLSRASVTAPVSGVIAQRNITLGDMANAANPAFVIYDGGALEIAATVVETDLSAVAVGDHVDLELAGLAPVSGVVRSIAPTVDSATRLGSVRITPQDTKNLRAGLFAGGWIITTEHQGLGVPATAVQADASGDFVFTVKDGVLHKQPVALGLTWEGQREVVSGLNADDVVVARAGAFFSDGDRVTVVDEGSSK